MKGSRSVVGLVTFGVTSLIVACSSGHAPAAGTSTSTGNTATGGGDADGGGGGGGEGGTSGPSGLVPRTQVHAIVVGDTGPCMNVGQEFAVGPPFSTANKTLVSDGDIEPDGKLSLRCSVVPTAGGYTVGVSMNEKQGDAGTLILSAAVTDKGIVNGPVRVDFNVAAAVYASTTCVLEPTIPLSGSAELRGIGPGHFWAKFHCTAAKGPGSSQLCGIDGEIRVENCVTE